ncbi:MAG: sigma 54-interacting transcriptional regulator [Myxococcota bacterium]
MIADDKSRDIESDRPATILEMSSSTPMAPSPTKVTYIDGRAATITLRRCRIDVLQGGTWVSNTFDRDRITIGATADNDLVIDDETVSRNHCQIFVEGEHYMIRDLGSTNGTFVNRLRVREAWLKPECIVTLGKSEVRFHAVDEEVRVVPSDKQRFGDVVGRNAKMREVYTILDKIAPTDATVILGGETGTGKEVVARTLHQKSRRRDGPFIVFDCGAVPENLIESELFGHEKGAFTGAIGTRQGVFELAHGGTVFLDELGELALDLQPKLLRVLEQREVKRVGSAKAIRLDVRVIAATNRDLEKEVRAGRFREDLFYRLSVVRVVLPPLRSRREDIPLLVEHFLRTSRFNQDRSGRPKLNEVAPETMECLIRYDWPGNVRELSNCIERAVGFAESDRIEVQDLPEHVAFARLIGPDPSNLGSSQTSKVDRSPIRQGSFKDAKEQWVSSFERDYIEDVLRRNEGNISHAAREADIDRKYFRKLMKKYEIESE